MALQFFGLLQGLPPRWRSASAAAPSRQSLRSLHDSRKATPRRWHSACSTASCRVRWSMPSPPRRRAPPERFPACSPWCRSDWEPFPAMLMMGGVGQVLAPAWRQRGVWLAGSFILLLGLITLGRGILPFAAHVGTCLAERISRMSERGRPSCAAIVCLPARLARDAAQGERRESRILLLWLLHRLSGEARQERGVGSRAGCLIRHRRRRLSLHEHHAVQPAALCRDFQRRRCVAACLGFTCCLWMFATPALIILGEPYLRDDLGHALEGRRDLLGAHRARRRRRLRLFGLRHHRAAATQVYFDTATMVLMLFTVGSYLEAAGRARAARDLEPLLAAESECATVVDGRDRRPAVRCGRSAPACWCGCGRASAFRSTAWWSRASRTPTKRVITGESRQITKARRLRGDRRQHQSGRPAADPKAAVPGRRPDGLRFAGRCARRSPGAARPSALPIAWSASLCLSFSSSAR